MALKDNLKSTGRKGVFYQEHETRRNGARKDRLWVLRYTIKCKTKTEVFGWSTEGLTELDAEKKIAEFRANAKKGSGVTSLAEERDAQQQVRELEECQRQQEKLQNSTFSQFFETVYFPQAKQDKTEGSWGAEDRLYRLWIKPVIGELTFAEISIAHLNKLKENMATGKRSKTKKHPRDKNKEAKNAQERRTPARPMSPRSINYAMAVIRQTWGLACAVKPPLAFGAWPGAVKAFKKPKVDNQRKRFLTKNEAAILLSALKKKSVDLHDMAILSLHCGMRAGEIFSLTWDKVSLAKGELLLVDTKNGESRTTYLTDQTKGMLQQRSIDCAHPRFVFVSGAIKGDPLKQKEPVEGKKYTAVPVTFSRTVKELKLNDGITDSRDKIVFHTLRHTYASWLVENGASLPIVRDLMGHKNLIMTSRYSHVSAEAQKSAVEALNQSMRAAGGNVIFIDKAKNE